MILRVFLLLIFVQNSQGQINETTASTNPITTITALTTITTNSIGTLPTFAPAATIPTLAPLPSAAPLPTIFSQVNSITSIAPGVYPSVGTVPNPVVSTGGLSIHIGLLIPSNLSTISGFDNTASAFTIALDRIYKEKLLPTGTNFTLTWRIEECVESTAVGYSFDLIVNQKVDALIAPPCIDGAVLAGHVASYYNIPFLLWGYTFDSEFTNTENYPTILSVLPNYLDLGNVICSAMKFFDWSLYALIYQQSPDGGCFSFQEDMETVSNEREGCVISYKEVIDSWLPEDINYTINQLKSKSRIILMCFDDSEQQRKFAIALNEAGMNTPDYVYLLADTDMQNEGLKDNNLFWNNPNITTGGTNNTEDNKAWEIAQLSFFIHVDKTSDEADSFTNFSETVVQRMADWPFYCAECARKKTNASVYASTLYDATYLYGAALSRIVNASGTNSSIYRNGKRLAKSSQNVTFEGLSGTVTIGEDGIRNSIYMLSTYINRDGYLKPWMSFVVADGGTSIQNATDVNDTSPIWDIRKGFRPVSTPKCGFDGLGCPIDFFTEYRGLVIAIIIVGALVLIAIVAVIVYIVKLRIRDNEAKNRLWQVNFSQLIKPEKRNKDFASARSFQSGSHSTSTKFTFDSLKSNQHYVVYMFGGERVIGVNHNITATHLRIDPRDMSEMRAMRNFDNENVNRFIGLALNGGSQTLSVWRYCSRGALCDVIVGNNMLNMDGFFIYSLIKDVCEGIKFLHNSSIQWHGNLKSTNCLIDDRWQVKLSDFGLKFLRNLHQYPPDELLWTAPELLRDNDYVGSKKGDIYSFSLISCEVLNMKPVWEGEEKRDNEDIIYMVKKGGRNPMRPVLDPVAQDISPALQHLVRDCWNEEPAQRPKIETVYTLLRSMNTARSSNLMDHVFSMLENYASNLEADVEERTKELIEEKKKSDILLYRMLPKQVADKLKVGQAVEPESFDKVTVFFSDVVSFTNLSAKCSPLQVVNLLNDLYTVLDSIIAEHDVYKVETIGDGYLCVSGLPHRNGNEHARNIANMSLSFIRSIKTFSVPHLPGEQIRLRIGLHSGPCVAGVVGLSMPRYCLFGDSVNTASRMESNGKPSRIHISADTNYYLTKVFKGYVTQPRGEILVKGKGVLETFWLLGMEGDPNLERFEAEEKIEQ